MNIKTFSEETQNIYLYDTTENSVFAKFTTKIVNLLKISDFR